MQNAPFFMPADILIPENIDMAKWSVIAVDQFSSEPEYWRGLEKAIGDAPSSLHIVIPEAFLSSADVEAETVRVNSVMDKYLADGLFKEYKNSFVFVRREITGGGIRLGLMGMADLEQYDYSPGTDAPIRATEQTVKSRLPARVSLRRNASLEMPHSMLLINDPEDKIMGSLEAEKASLPLLYDFDLSAGGGHIQGYLVAGENTRNTVAALDALWDRQDAKIVVGDGNHSLAAARECWEEKKKSLSASERLCHPARFALSELVNVYDRSMNFEPIHRLIFDTEPAKLLSALLSSLAGEEGYEISYVSSLSSGSFRLPAVSAGQAIEKLQTFLDMYTAENGGKIDYIHGEEALFRLSAGEDRLGLLFPELSSGDLFETVEKSGVFPRKSFSIGHARDKRYYLECRKISPCV